MNKKNKYTATITRQTPSAFIFLIDISGSMEDGVIFNGETMTKAKALARSLNSVLTELLIRCKRQEGYRDYFDIAVIGYGGDDARSLLPEGGHHKIFRKPSELANSKTSITKIFKDRELPAGKVITTVSEIRNWITPIALGKTPMFAGLKMAHDLAKEWIDNHKGLDCFPPIIINITDGEATDAHANDLINISNNIKSLETEDGNVLLINIYLSSDSSLEGVLFPISPDDLPEKPYAKLLFNMSSQMPEIYHGEITDITKRSNVEGSRGMSYNSSIGDIVYMLNIGSVSVNRLVE